ncbi:MAG: S8 family serine peptidase [Gemmatimonadetes bacterium]|nr:S8 family serine peptidase [Gemmatimonadota bacterium]MYF72047.1 S8 family serine peptidase [Gemmatimonadota bacterium]
MPSPNSSSIIENRMCDKQVVKVAIIDSGIDISHPSIGMIAGGVNISINKDGHFIYSGKVTDCAGHGTACAGIIRKKAPDAALYSVRIFDASLIADGRPLIMAIQWCIDNEMGVVNLSLGTTDVMFKEALQKVCRKAVDAGVILIAAESNDGSESYPAVFPEVIGVTGGAIADLSTPQQAYKPDGFYYRKDHRIECVTRGDEQRVCWLNGKHIMTGGNSFAAPHITGIIARLLEQHPKCSIQDIRLLLQEKALNEISQGQNKSKSGLQSHQKDFQEDYAYIKKAVLYPYNKEMHSLVRYRDLLAFEIVGVADPIGKEMVGKDAGKVIGESVANLRISPNIRHTMADADTLILGYVDQLSRIRKRDLLREYVQLALDEECHVFSFQALDPTVYGDLYDTADKKGLRLAYPHVLGEEITQAIQNFNVLPPVDVPVLSVMGTSSQQGKFTLQLALRRRLIQQGYKVGQIGTEHHSRLFGMDAAFPMGYASPLKLSFQHYIPYLDYKMREICQRTQPDIILTGSQSGTIPYHVQEHSTHCLSSLAFLLGVKPDACILVVNSIDAEEYIRDTIDGIRAVCKAPTILLAMGDHEKHIRTAYGRSMVTPKKMAQSQIDRHLKKLQDSFCVPAIGILSETGQQCLVETVIQYFSKNDTSTIA